MMTLFATKTIQQIRGLIILGGLAVLAIPFALILSGTVFMAIFIGLGIFAAVVVRKRVMWIRGKLTNREEQGD